MSEALTDPARVVNVLLVEDDPGDVLMTREAFEEHLHNRLDVVTDGAAALAYLRNEAPLARVAFRAMMARALSSVWAWATKSNCPPTPLTTLPSWVRIAVEW